MTRPRGITYLAIVFALFGVLILPAAWSEAVRLTASRAPLNVGLGVFTLLFPEVLIAAAIGLWRLRPWGWVVAGIGLFMSAATAVGGAVGAANAGARGGQLLRFALSLVALGYLVMPDVRAAFRKKDG